MKNKVWLCILLLCYVASSVYGQKTAKNIQEKEFGEIRAEMVREACNKFGYSNQNVIKFINPNNLNKFHNELANDTVDNSKVTWLWSAVGKVPPINGLDVNIDKKVLEKYLIQIQNCCQEHKNEGIDTIDGTKYRNKLNKLAAECIEYSKCEADNDYTNYKNKYPKGHFINLITSKDPKEDDDNVQPTEEDSSINQPALGEDKAGRADGEGGSGSGDSSKALTDGKILLIVILGTVIGGGIVMGFFVGYRYFKKMKKQTKDIVVNYNSPKQEDTPKATVIEREEESVDSWPDSKESKPPIIPRITSPKDSQWIVVGASVKGNGHIQSNMPCQDNHKFESIGNGWGVAVVSDGAGSASHSELGSKVVVVRAIFHFKKLIEEQGWLKNNTLPTDMEWWQKSYDVLKTIRNEVALVAKKNNVEVKSLSATCLVVIYSPLGLLAVHVGDGRMGYKSVTGEWKAMMTPHKGEEANQTIFLVSDFWSIPNFALSGVLVPESIVVREPVKAFTLMSDGCENTSWLCTTQNPETGKYFDQNKPFEGFFNPLEETLISFQANNVSDEEQQAKWNKFIESGTEGFVREQDDKTMIYGYCCTQQEIDDYIEKSKDPAPLN